MPRIRTGYSFRNAVGKIEDVMARLKEIDYPAAPITDRASAFGWVRWSKLAEKNGMRPVFGVELAVSKSINEKRPISDYWTFIAGKDLSAINKLIEKATEQFRYQPLLTYEQALESGVTIIIGHRSDLDLIPPHLNTYVGLGPASSKGYINKALKMKHRLIAVSDNKYVNEGDAGFYEVVCGRNASTQSYMQHILSENEWEIAVAKAQLSGANLRQAMMNTKSVLNKSIANLDSAQLLVPEKPKTLEAMCLEGAAKLNIDMNDPVYKERMYYELDLISEKNYEDYFYIVSDICEFARERMIVGPARGSSCGSLVCYALGITTVDPIPHGLIFERFIDINRDDLPDIDIDFSDQQRQLVFDYINDKYGKERCARLGTVAMYKSKSAIGESGAALHVPRWKCDAVSESMIERSSGDSRALNTLEDTFKTMPAGIELLEEFPEMIVATKMEGHPRHYSQHSAGICISQSPITETIPIDRRTGATMCDKKDAEDLNLLKIDALGLTQLSVFEDALEMAGLTRKDLGSIPMDDPKVFKILNDGHFAGIFQFNGMALQSITKQFKVECFDDIVCVTALGRPGPLASGGAHEWIRRKNGVNKVTYPHKIFTPYLKDTMGIVLYQEQVMEIGRNVGGLDWGQVTALRKAMSRSLGKEYFDQFGDPWKKGALAKGVDPKAADKIWDDLCAYGSWSFNKSHSVAYGIISYQCCWLKAHHPFEFAAATLTHEKDPARQIQLLREMKEEGYGYVPIDPERSGRKWTIGERDGKPVLVGPLSNVKGIGPKIVANITGARERGEKIPDRARKLMEDAVTPIDSLWPIKDGFKRLLPDPSERNIYTPPIEIKEVQIRSKDYEALVFCTLSKINPRDENEVVMIARRGYKIEGGLTTSLNLQLTDDTDTIFGKIDRWNFPKMGTEIIDRGRVGKALYAVKGRVRGGSSFRMIMIKGIRYIGDIEHGEN